MRHLFNQWLYGLGDGTFWGIVITVCYGIAIIASLYHISYLKESSQNLRRSLWIIILVIVSVLGFNKQLDLQLLLFLTGRSVFESLGFDSRIRSVQAYFALLSAIVVFFSFLLFFVRFRKILASSLLEASGALILLLFMMIRIGTMSHIRSIRSLEAQAFGRVHSLELLGLMLILLSIVLSHAKKRRGFRASSRCIKGSAEDS